MALVVTTAVVGAGALLAPPSFASTQGHRISLYATESVHLPFCQIPEDLDCIESVRVLSDGREAPLEILPSASGVNRVTYDDEDGEAVTFVLAAMINPLGWTRPDPLKPHRADLYVGIDREPDAEHPFHLESDVDCSTGVLDDCVAFEPLLPRDDRFEVTVRTSWMRPLQISTYGSDFRTRWEPIEGGHRFRLSARQMLMPLVDPLSSWPPPPGWDRPRGWDGRLYFIVDHAADEPDWSAFDTRCADKGFPIVARNAPVGGRPEWTGDSLDFASIGPHYAPDGSLFRGEFQAEIPLAWLRCRSGKAKLRPAMLGIEVVNEDGIEQAATTSLRSRKGTVHVGAFNFHFSRPTVRLVATTKSK
jgi:hypothetical protein